MATDFLTQDGDTLFAEIALHLFGDYFVKPMARHLDVGERTVQRWANGTRGMPPHVWPRLIELLREKAELLERFAASLDERCRREDFPQREASIGNAVR